MAPSISSYLLYIFCANLLAYTSYYMAMKVVEGEKLTFQPIIYFILAIAFWLPGLYYFVNSPVVGSYLMLDTLNVFENTLHSSKCDWKFWIYCIPEYRDFSLQK